MGAHAQKKSTLLQDDRLTGEGFEEPGFYFRAVDLGRAINQTDLVEYLVGIGRDVLNLP